MIGYIHEMVFILRPEFTEEDELGVKAEEQEEYTDVQTRPNVRTPCCVLVHV